MLLKLTEIEKLKMKSYSLGPWNKIPNYKIYHFNCLYEFIIQYQFRDLSLILYTNL